MLLQGRININFNVSDVGPGTKRDIASDLHGVLNRLLIAAADPAVEQSSTKIIIENDKQGTRVEFNVLPCCLSEPKIKVESAAEITGTLDTEWAVNGPFSITMNEK